MFYGGDNHCDAGGGGEGLGDEARRRGDERAGVARGAVRLDQIERALRYQGREGRAEVEQPAREPSGLVDSERADGEAVHLHHVHPALRIQPAVGQVAGLEVGGQRAERCEVPREHGSAVERDQRVVEVEQRDLHLGV